MPQLPLVLDKLFDASSGNKEEAWAHFVREFTGLLLTSLARSPQREETLRWMRTRLSSRRSRRMIFGG